MSCAHSWGYALPFYRGCVTKKLPPCRMCRTRTGAELPWYHLASPRSCERGLVGWCLTSPRAVTGAPVAGSIFTCAARRPSSAQRCLPASILRAFCQVPAVHTLLVKASLCVSKGHKIPFNIIIRKKGGFVNEKRSNHPRGEQALIHALEENVVVMRAGIVGGAGGNGGTIP